MGESEQFQEILSLGKTLVTLFSEYDRTDLTTSWMAHYLAEAMQQATEEKDVKKKRALQKECSDIILELWKKRNHFPGFIPPLSGLRHAVDVIKALKDEESDELYWRRFSGAEKDSIWGAYFHSLRNAVEDSLKITLSATVAHSVLEREKQWGKHASFLMDQEKEIIEFLDKELDRNETLVKIIYADESKSNESEETPDKMTRVFKKLRELLNKQTAALNKLEDQILKPKEKTSRARRTNRP